MHISKKTNDKRVLWVINYNLKPYLGTIHLIYRKFTSERHAHKIFLLLRPEKSGLLHCKSSPSPCRGLVWFQYKKTHKCSGSSMKDSVKGDNGITGKVAEANTQQRNLTQPSFHVPMLLFNM